MTFSCGIQGYVPVWLCFFCVCEASVRRNDVFAGCYWGLCLSILWEMISPHPLSRWNIRKNEDGWPSLWKEVTIAAWFFFPPFFRPAWVCVAAVNYDPSSPLLFSLLLGAGWQKRRAHTKPRQSSRRRRLSTWKQRQEMNMSSKNRYTLLWSTLDFLRWFIKRIPCGLIGSEFHCADISRPSFI